MGFEIERKWLPGREYAEKLITGADHAYIEQGYICCSPVLRIRKEGAKKYLTCKGEGFLKREEINLPLSEEAYMDLSSKCEGTVIKKERYFIPYEGYDIELDIFKGKYEGLIILEVEFPDIESAEAFTPPVDFGEEVTGNIEYTNAFLSSVSESGQPECKGLSDR